MSLRYLDRVAFFPTKTILGLGTFTPIGDWVDDPRSRPLSLDDRFDNRGPETMSTKYTSSFYKIPDNGQRDESN